MTRPITIPTHCPSCNTPLITSSTGVDLLCPNQTGCPDQIVQRLTYFCNRQNANIVGLSEKSIQKMVTHLGITDVLDLFDLPYDIIENWEGFGAKSIHNLKTSIEKSKSSMTAATFLTSLGIEGIGPEIAKLVIKYIL